MIKNFKKSPTALTLTAVVIKSPFDDAATGKLPRKATSAALESKVSEELRRLFCRIS
ncbi:unnamed protein product, partial [Ixodes pacificus]